MNSEKISQISVTQVPTFYRQEIGKNSMRDNIGLSKTEWILRAKTDAGNEGIVNAARFMNQPHNSLEKLRDTLKEIFLGFDVKDFFTTDANGKVTCPNKRVEKAFSQPQNGWMSILASDLLGRNKNIPATLLFNQQPKKEISAYDTTLYFHDQLYPSKGVSKLVEDATSSVKHGYTEMKIKVGRPGKWMLPMDGLKRDIEVVTQIREAVGRNIKIMVDANFGYDNKLDLLETFIRETDQCNLYWLEEMVTQNVEDYKKLRSILEKIGSSTMLVCGEVDRQPISPIFEELIKNNLIDGYQPDILGEGFTNWLKIEARLKETKVRSIPHCFGNGNFGTRANIIFGSISENFVSVEDERYLPNIFLKDSFKFENGKHILGNFIGLGLTINEEIFESQYSENEIIIT